MHKVHAAWRVVALVGPAVLMFGGCAAFDEGPGEARERAVAAARRLDETAAERERLAATLHPGDPRRERLAAEAVLARASRAALDESIRNVDAVLNEAGNPTSPISAGAGAVAPFLPPPLGAAVLLGGALAATLLRAGQLKSALRSMARSVEAAMNDDEELRRRFRDQAATVRSIQTPTARRVVDEVQEGYRLVLPI